jgi:hypothetical protein
MVPAEQRRLEPAEKQIQQVDLRSANLPDWCFRGQVKETVELDKALEEHLPTNHRINPTAKVPVPDRFKPHNK